ncbi:hypothetical protein GCM10007916_11210 [Psychromonas marina]|uniref:DUF3142 domain-containing protein n=1 Tax=Psychromonas marina TaxID=88364 RepID=A0ABQ6DYI1_9GAMM|nr:hypothetical protein [Psychromonas marina]GLS90054.1 hypothetical protein GCM10007916_11210 [Psychromonas marina]
MSRIISFIFITLFSSSLFANVYPINLSADQTQQLGQLIWKNEGQNKVEHLTTWNQQEDFPSLGLGHFIWYPTSEKGPFKEQFPALVDFMSENGAVLPTWLTEAKVAPWQSREQFYAAFEGPQLTELRLLLSQQLQLQTRFIILRLERAIPLILESSTALEQQVIEQQLKQLATPEGVFTLLDYVNFKGEGVNPKERYQGDGWGLKQVLLTMPIHYDNPLRSFGFAADEVLTRRVKNAPRDEQRWLKGWRVRVHAYQDLKIID